MPISDFQINAKVRSVLARHWLDTHRVIFGSFRGTVRLGGELRVLGDRGSSHLDCAKLDLIERELKRIQGVQRVYFDFNNWRKSETGEWTCMDAAAVHGLQSDRHVVLEMEDSQTATATVTRSGTRKVEEK